MSTWYVVLQISSTCCLLYIDYQSWPISNLKYPRLGTVVWQSKCDKNIKKQTQLCNRTGILDNCKLNCAKVQRSWMLQTQLCKSTKVAISTVQSYRDIGCCKLNCAKVQRSWMLPTQLCKSTKVVDAANSTVQKYKGRRYCKLNCAKVQRLCMLQSQLCNPTGILDNC